MEKTQIEIRTPSLEELPAVAVLAGRLVREHHAWDTRRFMLPEPVEANYERWLAAQMQQPGTVLLAAFVEGRVVGYAYGALEPRSWVMLLEPHGALHDLYVDADHRCRGVARALVDAMLDRLRQLGAPRVLLSSAWKNDKGQRYFERLGFRRTMVEMTIELDETR